MANSGYEKLSSSEEEAEQCRSRSWLYSHRKHVLIGAVIVLIALAIILTIAILGISPKTSPSKLDFSKSSAHFRFSAIADDAGICGDIGNDVLALLGGSTVDAAIATTFCSGVANAHSAGIGGGTVMTIYDTPRGGDKKEMTTIIAKERAPLAATRDLFHNASSMYGGLAIGVPGYVRGLYTAWQRFGRAPWSALVEPTIRMCRHGYPVNSALNHAIEALEPVIRANPELRQQFIKPSGEPYKSGDLITCHKLARTLEKIAQDPDSFYDPESQLARDIVADIQDAGGIISEEDLSSYRATEKEPLNITLRTRGLHVFTPRPPAAGAVFSHILNIMDGYKLGPYSLATSHNKTLTYHRMAEAFKFAYAKSPILGDEEFVDIKQVVDKLISRSYADQHRAQINDRHTLSMDAYEPEFHVQTRAGTSHVSLLGPDGAAVSITASINVYFGAKVPGPRTGIIFNNAMDDFAKPGQANFYKQEPAPQNFIEPGKMPASSMCPHIVLDAQSGRVRYVGGASGGTAIPSASASAFMHSVWMGESLKDTIASQRLHHQLMPHELCVEGKLPQLKPLNKKVLEGLKKRGHVIAECSFAIVQAIQNTCLDKLSTRTERCISAVSDIRKAGRPVGL